jgi:hypothetical protein
MYPLINNLEPGITSMMFLSSNTRSVVMIAKFSSRLSCQMWFECNIREIACPKAIPLVNVLF